MLCAKPLTCFAQLPEKTDGTKFTKTKTNDGKGCWPFSPLEIKCVKVIGLILTIEYIEMNLRSVAIIPERAFLMSVLFLNYSSFKFYDKIYQKKYLKL